MDDRRVHAVTAIGSEVVRYGRAGKWYLEAAGEKRQPLSLAAAVRLAAGWDADLRLGLPGGRMFDAAVRRKLDL